MSRTKGRDAAATREQILLAAQDVVLTDGVAKLTLDAAAERAGVSKGGVLYHFKSRNDLVAAMVDRLAQRFEAGLAVQRERLGPDAPFAQVYVEECLADTGSAQDEHEERVGAALVVALAARPDLLAPLTSAFAGWQRRIEQDAADPIAATIARLAVDGLWLCELFAIDALTPARRAEVAAALRAMVG